MRVAGTPVAAYPVDGPLQVLGQDNGECQGGVLHEDLQQAALRALQVPRSEARTRALAFDWQEAVRLFMCNLVPVQADSAAELSRYCHGACTQSGIESTN